MAAFAPQLARAQTDQPPRVGGYIQVRETWTEATHLTATLNRARLSVDGSLPHAFTYRVLVEYEVPAGVRQAAGVSLRDAYIRWSRAPWTITAGQFKTPFSREYITSITAVDMADRPTVVDTLATKRDLGVMGEWSAAWATASLGVFNGEGQNAVLNRDSTQLWVSRLVLKPVSELNIGGSVAFYGDDSTRAGLEATIERSGALLRGELIGQHRHGREQDDYGWFILAGWRLFPLVQILARHEDFLRPSIGEARRITANTVGTNLDLPGGRTRVLLNFVSRATGVPREWRETWIGQLQVRF